MKNCILILICCFVVNLHSQTTYTWTGAAGNNLYSDANNWNPNGSPTNLDDIVFDASSSINCNLDVFPSEANNVLINGYTGSITNALGNDVSFYGTYTQNSGSVDFGPGIISINGAMGISGGTLTAGTGICDILSTFTLSSGVFNGSSALVTVYGAVTLSNGTLNSSVPNMNFQSTFSQSGGVFNGLTSTVFIGGNFTLSGGTFNSTSVDLSITGTTISRTAGTFNNNSGNVNFNISGSSSISGTFVFNKLQIFPAGASSSQRSCNFNTSVTTSTLSLNPGVRSFRYLGTISILSKLDIVIASNATSPVGNTGTFNFNGTSANISSSVASGFSKLQNITINTSGALSMSGNISITGTWLNTNCGSFTTGTSTVSMYGGTITAGNSNTTRANFDNLTAVSGNTVSISGSSEVNINGALTNDGVLNTNTSLIRLTGVGIQSIAGAAASTTINALEVTNAGAKTISSAIVVTDSVKISGTGNLICGGFLTLPSTATKKARIAAIAAGGSVSGNVVIQNYLPGGTTGWANLGSPGLSGQTMSNWNSAFAITCSGCPVTDVGGAAFESVYSYNETLGAGTASNSAHYIPISGLGDAISPGVGYWVYLGDGQTTTNDIYATMTGNINQNNSFGGISLTLTGGVNSENGWNVIANPYPAPISLNSMFAGNTGNVDNTIQIWNADLNGGAGDWALVPLATGTIPMGQGFMVRALANVNLTGSESWKTTSNASVQRSGSGQFNFNDLFKLNLKGGGSNNFDTYTYFDFNNSHSVGFDNGFDVYALDNASGTAAQIYSRVNSERYAVGAFPLPPANGSSIIPIHVTTGYSGTYTISPINIENTAGLCIELIDLSNNNIKDLALGSYVTNINANNGTTPLFNLKVSDCGASGGNPTSINTNQSDNSIFIRNSEEGALIKFNFDQSKNASISVTNVLGQKIIEDQMVNAYKESVTLQIPEKNQVIFVTVKTDKQSVTKKIIR